MAAVLSRRHTRAEDLGLDTSRTVLWGESAGGHLAALTALTQHTRTRTRTRTRTGTGTGTGTIAGGVTWYAATDLPGLAEDRPADAYDPQDPTSFEALLLGGAPADRTEAARDASPVIHVSPKTPPFLIPHGTDDALIPARQSVRLANAPRAAGRHPDPHLLTGGNHLWLGLSDEDVEECYVRTLDFARCHTGGNTGASSSR
ncbi:alpha/beta hydrolase [Streptomyces sp. CSDS2]|uniref:alpha/beta hydrolase n=1 Tax=Streptomyces sp. CSDS2 TaxID=3055051 RepID=UPI0025B10811|nr:alpha/beta hydrolase [Streptomyces sp. CSDS2]MDN3258767.1 alpha/beta hydrolase [Streptomyces sp. CSDS2]